VIDRLTLPEVYDLFEYWREWPPTNELMAHQIGWEKPLTMEEKLEQGTMGPADFLRHFKQTGGRLTKH
jgi:hypothetical protein